MRNDRQIVASRPRPRGNVRVPVTLVSEQDWSHPTEREEVTRLLANVETITLRDTCHFSPLNADRRGADSAAIELTTLGRPSSRLRSVETD